MSVFYQKTKSGDYNLSQLQNEINTNAVIVPSCLAITSEDTTLNLEFATSLSGAEETELNTVVSDHIPTPQEIDVTQLPFSDLDGKKLSVHPSYKPKIETGSTYAVWTGSGDDINDSSQIGNGELLHFSLTIGGGDVTKDVKFHPDHGRIWLHEGYLKFENGGVGDYITADVIAEATPLQTSVNLDLEVANNWITAAAGGSGTGTHGWADANKIVLVPRTFSLDGDWDYDGVTLTPNTGGTGKYKISDIERVVHRYINKIPCYGSCATYFSMTSDETTELPAHYFLRVLAKNTSNTDWTACVLMEIYRERTYIP